MVPAKPPTKKSSAAKARAAKTKGRDFENQIVDYLKSVGINCERRIKHGVNDKGDVLIYNNPSFVIEAKNTKRIELSSFIDQLESEISNVGGVEGVVIVKRPRKSITEAYVVMTLEMFIKNFYRG